MENYSALVKSNLLSSLDDLKLSKQAESELYYDAAPSENDEPLSSLNPTFVLKRKEQLSKEELEQIKRVFACKENIAKFTPVEFKYARNAKEIYIAILSRAKNGFIHEDEIENLPNGVDEKTFCDIAGSINAQHLLEENFDDLVYTFTESLKSANPYYTFESHTGERFLINKRYILALFKENRIVGAETETGKYVIFDKVGVKPKHEIEEASKNMEEEFASIHECFEQYLAKNANSLIKTMKNGSPEEIMDYISSSSIGSLFEKSAGNWEGYSIKEHTESVLRWFSDRYKNELDENLSTLMTFLLVAHDMGKGIAVEHRDKSKQDEYNFSEAQKWFSSLNFPKPVQNILLFVIRNGETYTSKYFVHNQPEIKTKFNTDAKKVFETAFRKSPTPNELDGLWKICTILQSCDSGAYTRYGVSRRFEFYHYNGNDNFTKSFLAKKCLDLVNPDMKEPI